eukprot:92759-Pyramimonas_sp.AAC.1
MQRSRGCQSSGSYGTSPRPALIQVASQLTCQMCRSRVWAKSVPIRFLPFVLLPNPPSSPPHSFHPAPSIPPSLSSGGAGVVRMSRAAAPEL